MFHSSAFISIITPVIYSKNINQAGRVTGSLGRGLSPASRRPSSVCPLCLGSVPGPTLGRRGVGDDSRAGQGGFISESAWTLGLTKQYCQQGTALVDLKPG